MIRNFTRYLLGIHIGAFLVLCIAQYWLHANWVGWLTLSLPALFHGQLWTVATFSLVHINILSFIFAGLILYWLSEGLQQWYTEREMIFTYAMACLTGIGLWFATQIGHAVPSELAGLGPVLLTWFSLYCFRNWYGSISFILFIFPITLPARLLFAIIAAYQAFMWLFMEIPSHQIAANSANIGGILFAYLYHFQPWTKIAWPRMPKMPKPAPKQELTPAEQVDQILEKISRKGINSLSKTERSFLED